MSDPQTPPTQPPPVIDPAPTQPPTPPAELPPAPPAAPPAIDPPAPPAPVVLPSSNRAAETENLDLGAQPPAPPAAAAPPPAIDPAVAARAAAAEAAARAAAAAGAGAPNAPAAPRPAGQAPAPQPVPAFVPPAGGAQPPVPPQGPQAPPNQGWFRKNLSMIIGGAAVGVMVVFAAIMLALAANNNKPAAPAASDSKKVVTPASDAKPADSKPAEATTADELKDRLIARLEKRLSELEKAPTATTPPPAAPAIPNIINTNINGEDGKGNEAILREIAKIAGRNVATDGTKHEKVEVFVIRRPTTRPEVRPLTKAEAEKEARLNDKIESLLAKRKDVSSSLSSLEDTMEHSTTTNAKIKQGRREDKAELEVLLGAIDVDVMKAKAELQEFRDTKR